MKHNQCTLLILQKRFKCVLFKMLDGIVTLFPFQFIYYIHMWFDWILHKCQQFVFGFENHAILEFAKHIILCGWKAGQQILFTYVRIFDQVQRNYHARN